MCVCRRKQERIESVQPAVEQNKEVGVSVAHANRRAKWLNDNGESFIVDNRR